jgi:hypothetical protein
VARVTFRDVLAARTQSRAPHQAAGRTATRGVLLRATAAAGVLLLATGCLKTKTAEGRALHSAPERLGEQPGVSLSLTVSSRLVRQGSLTSVPPADPGFHVDGVLDLASGRASYTSGGKPVAVFDSDEAYARRPHARTTDARPWVAVEVDEDIRDLLLDPGAMPPSLALLALRPTVLVDALSGALTGSIDKHGTEDVDGTPTTRYTARFDLTQALDKAERHHYSQDEQDDLAKLFEVLGIKEDALHEGAVWLDAQGLPRRLELAVREEPTPQSLILLLIDLRLTPTSAPVVDVPALSAVTKVPSLFQYLLPLKPETKA